MEPRWPRSERLDNAQTRHGISRIVLATTLRFCIDVVFYMQFIIRKKQLALLYNILEIRPREWASRGGPRLSARPESVSPLSFKTGVSPFHRMLSHYSGASGTTLIATAIKKTKNNKQSLKVRFGACLERSRDSKIQQKYIKIVHTPFLIVLTLFYFSNWKKDPNQTPARADGRHESQGER
jgi:hypothetical protein